MFKFIKLLSITLLLILGLSKCVDYAPNNYIDVAVPAGLTATEVKNIIIKAGGKQMWLIGESTPGTLTAATNVYRVVGISIPYSAYSYSLIYNPAANPQNIRGKVTADYNQVLYNLNSQIQYDLRKYAESKK